MQATYVDFKFISGGNQWLTNGSIYLLVTPICVIFSAVRVLNLAEMTNLGLPCSTGLPIQQRLVLSIMKMARRLTTKFRLRLKVHRKDGRNYWQEVLAIIHFSRICSFRCTCEYAWYDGYYFKFRYEQNSCRNCG